MEHLSQVLLNQVLQVSWCVIMDSHYSLETTQRSSVLSPVRRFDPTRESTLPIMTSLSPVQTQSLNTFSGGTSYSLNDSVPDAALIREDDAGTLIPPDDAPQERLPPAYHPSWVSRNTSPRTSSFSGGSFPS